MGMPVRASFNLQALLGVGRCLRLCGLASNALAVGNPVVERSTFCVLSHGAGVHKALFQRLTSDQVGIPAELKHINKRRKRNQQGLPLVTASEAATAQI